MNNEVLKWLDEQDTFLTTSNIDYLKKFEDIPFSELVKNPDFDYKNVNKVWDIVHFLREKICDEVKERAKKNGNECALAPFGEESKDDKETKKILCAHCKNYVYCYGEPGTDADFDTHAVDVQNGYGYYDENGNYVSYGPNAI